MVTVKCECGHEYELNHGDEICDICDDDADEDDESK